MSLAFAFETRVLSCVQCGAPVQGSAQGGTVTCSYCQTANQIVARDDRSEAAAAAEPAAMSEAERFASLRSQEGSPIPTPPALQHLFPKGLEATPGPAAQEEWKRARDECAQGASGFAAAERLYFLTLALSTRMGGAHERSRQRAMIETALDHLEDRHHRQVLHSLLAQEAARDGDVQSAEQWLTLSSPHSDDLRADTAYRVAKALVATRKGDFGAVLAVLGSHALDVPIAEEHDDLCALLRANASERAGELQVAVEQLLPVLMTPPRAAGVEQTLADNAAFELCPVSYPQASAQANDLLANTLSTPSVTLIGIFPILVPLAVGVLLMVLMKVLAIGEPLATAVPLIGGFGLAFAIIVAYVMSARRLDRDGIHTTALVLRAVDTGTRSKDGTSHIKLLLLIELPDKPRYTVWYHQQGMRSSEAPGNRVPVILHPTRRRRLRVP